MAREVKKKKSKKLEKLKGGNAACLSTCQKRRSMMAEVGSTNREENFLQIYFNGLAQSGFDKCKEVVVSASIF